MKGCHRGDVNMNYTHAQKLRVKLHYLAGASKGKGESEKENLGLKHSACNGYFKGV